MIIVASRLSATITAITVAALLFAWPALAQPLNPQGWGPGMMMGPAMMGWGMMGPGMCDPRAAGLAEWRIDRIERSVRPTEAQRPALEELKTASQKAAETIAAACPKELPQSPVARLDVMGKRLDAMSQAIKIVQPPFEKFYASLSKEQQERLQAAGPRRWGWRGWHHWW